MLDKYVTMDIPYVSQLLPFQHSSRISHLYSSGETSNQYIKVTSKESPHIVFDKGDEGLLLGDSIIPIPKRVDKYAGLYVRLSSYLSVPSVIKEIDFLMLLPNSKRMDISKRCVKHNKRVCWYAYEAKCRCADVINEEDVCKVHVYCHDSECVNLYHKETKRDTKDRKNQSAYHNEMERLWTQFRGLEYVNCRKVYNLDGIFLIEKRRNFKK